MTISELEPQIAKLNRAEKVHLLQILGRDIGQAWPGVEKTVGVVGGEARIVRTRIPVEAQILEDNPTLRAADLVNAWAYVDANESEIDQAIQENETA